MRNIVRNLLSVFALSLLIAMAGGAVTDAAQSASSNYQVNETFFGSGGSLSSSSANYSAKLALGETAVGNSASANYQFQAGFNTSDTPLLEFAVNGGAYDLGYLDEASAAAVTATFSARSYLISGYIVTINGAPPGLSSGQHTLAAMSSPDISRPGTEQFGVNLADNTTPNVGANPVQVPDSSFAFGAATTGYDTPDYFKYLDGDTIAFSTKSTGRTDYTLTILANIAHQTPAGQYSGSLSLQIIPMF